MIFNICQEETRMSFSLQSIRRSGKSCRTIIKKLAQLSVALYEKEKKARNGESDRKKKRIDGRVKAAKIFWFRIDRTLLVAVGLASFIRGHREIEEKKTRDRRFECRAKVWKIGQSGPHFEPSGYSRSFSLSETLSDPPILTLLTPPRSNVLHYCEVISRKSMTRQTSRGRILRPELASCIFIIIYIYL